MPSPSRASATRSARATTASTTAFRYVEYARRRGSWSLSRSSSYRWTVSARLPCDSACRQIPLVDVKAQYAPLIPRAEAAPSRDVLDDGRFIFGPNVRGVRGGGGRVPRRRARRSASPTAPTRSCSRSTRSGSARATRSSARPSRSTRPPRRSRGAARRPSSPTSTRTTLNLDPEDVAARITPRTKAIMPVHLFGRPAPLDELAALGLPLIEDAAQAFGVARRSRRTASSRPSASIPTKNLFALGDGGLVADRDAELAERIRHAPLPRLEGQEDLRVRRLQLAPRRDAGRVPAASSSGSSTSGRGSAARPPPATASSASASSSSVPEDEPGHVYHLFVCRSPQRDAICAALAERGIAHGDLLPAAAAPAAGARATSATGSARCP